jgi:hypothetical protein
VLYAAIDIHNHGQVAVSRSENGEVIEERFPG